MAARNRKKTKQVMAGAVAIGGDAPVSIQSMTSIPLEDVAGTINQVNRLYEAGAQIVRLALRDEVGLPALSSVIRSSPVALCADIHFNYRLALGAIKAGINKIRINPGNIGDPSRVAEVVRAAKDYGVPIRIGVNGGSLDRKKYAESTPENLVSSALDHVQILEDNNFFDIIVSIKTSGLLQTIEANRLFSEKRDYPLHIGLTEAGYGLTCTVQSSVVLGHLLLAGLGDTMRVSMTGDPVQEVVVAKKILEAVGERTPSLRIISCPTCGRTDPGLDILELAMTVEREATARFAAKLEETGKRITLAVIGCEVNGPGEAAEADAGLAGIRKGSLLLFARGEKLRKVTGSEAVTALLAEVEKMV